MESNRTNEGWANGGAGRTFSPSCLRSCRRILAPIRKTKAGILAESRNKLAADQRMLRLALNEAEAVAWQTAYPHLVFPALAAEKVQAVVDWNRRQKAIRQTEPLLVLAA